MHDEGGNVMKEQDRNDSKNMLDRLMNCLPKAVYHQVPNILTSIRLVGSIALAIVIALTGVTNPLLMGGLATLTIGTDFLDGLIARRYHLESKLGVFLDAAVDKVFAWGLAIALLASGGLPLTLGLISLLPIAVRDLAVTVITAKDKYRDGMLKQQQELLQEGKHVSDAISETENNCTLGDHLAALQKGEAMLPTLPAKIKTWTSSIAIISAIVFGIGNLPGNLLYGLGILGSYGCILADIPKVVKNAKRREEERTDLFTRFVDDIEKNIDPSTKEKWLHDTQEVTPKLVQPKDSEFDAMLDQIVDFMENDTDDLQIVRSHDKVYQKKGNKHE